MKFSIITPSYNQGRFIRDCIESVKAQTGVEWEHIVQDAGSTDETLAILKEYPHLNWVSEPDAGMSDGINRGFRKATGDWVMWLNADDYLLPDALAKVCSFAERHPGSDVVYGGWYYVNKDRMGARAAFVFPFDLLMMIHHGCYLGSTACFYRKATTIDAGFMLNPEFRQVMDQEYYARLGRAGKKFAYLPDLIAAFRIHGDNTSFRYMHARSMAEILARQHQLAEGAAVRRAYGFTPFKGEMANAVSDSLLWYAFRLKRVLLKIAYGSFVRQWLASPPPIAQRDAFPGDGSSPPPNPPSPSLVTL